MRRLLPILSLALASCVAWPEVSTLPPEVAEDIRARDPRLQQIYDRYHPVPPSGLHLKTSLRKVNDARTHTVGLEFWIFVSGPW